MFAVSFKLKDGGRHHREFDITEYTVSSFETVYMASDARFVYYKYCAYIGYALCYDSVLRLQRRGPHLSVRRDGYLSYYGTRREAQRLAQVSAWYDGEWASANRLVELAAETGRYARNV